MGKGTPMVIGAPSILFLIFILKDFDADKLYEKQKNKRKQYNNLKGNNIYIFINTYNRK
tara:strand:+ start:2583 stop:2759 length:177 start_codon:yes stop_codon:yes gene_type:complete